jgi:hypothetical protein
MNTFSYALNIQNKSASANACAQHMALIAHGLLGEVDVHWTQEIDDTGVTMRFQQPEHIAQFATRWHSLTEEDWYQSLDHSNSNSNQARRSLDFEYECEIVLSFQTLFDEHLRIEQYFTASGIPNADKLDLIDDAFPIMMIKLRRLAGGIGVEGFDFQSHYENGIDKRVTLRFRNEVDMYRYQRALKDRGWCE